MHDEDPQFDRLPDELVARLKELDRSRPIVDPRTDHAILDRARATFASRPERSVRAVRRWTVPAVAAAAIVLAVLLVQPMRELGRDSNDVDGSGRVDVLDAFALARAGDYEGSANLAAQIVALTPRSRQ
jgi:hypothetical protein